jgi:transcriptional regulator with XRE-family HTH domain
MAQKRLMDFEEKKRLARTGDAEKPAAAIRLRAARAAIQFSQEQLGKAGGVKKAAISNAESGSVFPNRTVMQFLNREHRIDFNFLINGDFVQLPGDVQDRLFFALANLESATDQK